MKKSLAILAAPIVLLAASTATADNQWGFTPYVGADAEWRHFNFQKGEGDNIFRHDYPQGNVYVGFKFSEFFAVEGGYEATARKSRSVNFGAGDTVGGVPVPITAAGPGKLTSTSQTKGAHVNLVGFLPFSDSYRLQVVGLVGLARLNENSEYKITQLAGQPFIGIRTFKQRKSVLRLGAGLQQHISENWGVRAMLKWENTNRLRIGSAEGPSKIKGRNSLIYSFGAFMTF